MISHCATHRLPADFDHVVGMCVSAVDRDDVTHGAIETALNEFERWTGDDW